LGDGFLGKTMETTAKAILEAKEEAISLLKMANGQLYPPGYTKMDCNHSSDNGIFLVREYELVLYFSEERVPAGDLPDHMISAIEQKTFEEEEPHLSGYLLDSDETYDHCHGPDRLRPYCFLYNAECEDQALEYKVLAQCGQIKSNARYNWSTDLDGEDITNRKLFWDSLFRDIVVQSLTGAKEYVNDAYDYSCSRCRMKYTSVSKWGSSVSKTYLNPSYTMPNEGGVVLIRNWENVNSANETFKDVAHFKYFANTRDENWYQKEGPGGSVACSAELAIVLGAAGFIPGLGVAAGVTGLGLSIGCASYAFDNFPI
jgi:hypothetical protein